MVSAMDTGESVTRMSDLGEAESGFPTRLTRARRF
jgi:hypothetical protein